MNISGEAFVCLVAWAFTLVRFKAVNWKDVRKDNGMALNLWLMMAFFSVTITYIGEFGVYIDGHTINNLSKLIGYPSILVTIYLAAREALNTTGEPLGQQVGRWLGPSLAVTITALVAIYALFLWDAPEFAAIPQNLPEAMFRFVTFFWGGMLCTILIKVYLAYFPRETSPVLRLRAFMMILCACSTLAYFLIKLSQVAGYFWFSLPSAALNRLSVVLLLLSSILYFVAFLSTRIYVQSVVISRNFQGWNTLQDLRYLMRRLLLLCPDITLPPADPPFLIYIFNSEYYLYRALIAIMDEKTILDDLLAEGALHGEPALWEGETLREVVQVKQVLQSISPSGDFWEMIGEYRRASRVLFQSAN